mmetsp:Transcript_147220/g.367127  ORF Transcript_147220/g.367127 Transcript_147220/m.367127 type:complete len:261 (-) Transcript_147220:276-1058(-)
MQQLQQSWAGHQDAELQCQILPAGPENKDTAAAEQQEQPNMPVLQHTRSSEGQHVLLATADLRTRDRGDKASRRLAAARSPARDRSRSLSRAAMRSSRIQSQRQGYARRESSASSPSQRRSRNQSPSRACRKPRECRGRSASRRAGRRRSQRRKPRRCRRSSTRSIGSRSTRSACSSGQRARRETSPHSPPPASRSMNVQHDQSRTFVGRGPRNALSVAAESSSLGQRKRMIDDLGVRQVFIDDCLDRNKISHRRVLVVH